MSAEPESEYALLFPFTACISHGGPYEDQAFVAGVQLGHLMESMVRGDVTVGPGQVRSDLVEQVDLAAMHYGYDLHAVPWDEAPEEWTQVTLNRSVMGK